MGTCMSTSDSDTISENTKNMYENPSECDKNIYNTLEEYQHTLEEYKHILQEYDNKMKEMMEKNNEINKRLLDSTRLAFGYLDENLLLKHERDTALIACAKTTKTLKHQNKVLQTHIQRIHPNTV